MAILDSGDRTQFDTGAVRDMQQGKGRCDLLPMDVLADILRVVKFENNVSPLAEDVFNALESFKQTGISNYLVKALAAFMYMDKSFPRWTTMLLEVSVHFEEGAAKYGDNNWQKGIPIHAYINSGTRHFIKCLRGDQDEDHARAFCWNLLCAMWTCKHKPELNEYAKRVTNSDTICGEAAATAGE